MAVCLPAVINAKEQFNANKQFNTIYRVESAQMTQCLYICSLARECCNIALVLLHGVLMYGLPIGDPHVWPTQADSTATWGPHV